VGIQRKRILALLDVDNTLIFGSEPNIRYNDNLIDTLLENGVKDVYLFSSMSLKKDTVKERVALIEYLEKKGITVHGAICASDLIWNKDKALLTEFYQTAINTKNDDELIKLLLDQKFASLNHFDDAKPGQAFATSSKNIDELTREDAYLYQNASSAIRRFLNQNETSQYAKDIAETEKSYFYQMMVENMPDWASNVIFVDDAAVNIKAVTGMHNKLSPKHLLLTVCNRNQKKEVENSKDFYQDFIAPFAARANALYDAFDDYRLGRRMTHSRQKNQMLKRLENALDACTTQDHLDVWNNTFIQYYEQLNAHRFSFWSHTQTRSATIFENMYNARKTQLLQ
jgi:hypothetical protein